MIRLPPRSTRFPCTTLFRSVRRQPPDSRRGRAGRRERRRGAGVPAAPRRRDRRRPRAGADGGGGDAARTEEHKSELQSRQYLVCRLLLEKKTIIRLLLPLTY